ncbi:alpha/beta fold hydrolase [Bradyrhizobium liaoningense]
MAPIDVRDVAWKCRHWYVCHALSNCVRAISEITQNRRPAVIGHSLGGTLAAIFAAMAPESICALVLLGASLCFEPGSSRFRDVLVSMTPSPFGYAGFANHELAISRKPSREGDLAGGRKDRRPARCASSDVGSYQHRR